MKVVVEEINPKKNIIEAGDLVVYEDGNTYIICDHNINGQKFGAGVGLNTHMWTSNPQKAVEDGEAELFKKGEWEIIIRPVKN